MKNLLLFSAILFQSLIVKSQSIPLDSAVLYYTDPETGDFTRNQIVVFHYNGNWLPDLKYYIEVDDISGDTTDLNRDIFTYNDLGQIITLEGQRWNSTTSEWERTSQEISTYNANEKRDTVTLYFYSSGEIFYGTRSIYEYNVSDELISEYQENWDSFDKEWTKRSKWTYAYALVSGQEVLLTTTRYSWTNETWEFYSRRTNTYNSDRKIIKTLNQLWNTSNSSWINDYKSNSSYDNLSRLENTVYYNWDLGSLWVHDDSTCYRYDEDNNLTSETYYDGTGVPTDPWAPMYLAEATYNLDIDFSSIIWPLEPGLITNVPFTKQLIQVIESSYNGGWIKDDKVEFYYGPEITSLLDVEYLVDAIYPNPASDEVWLKLPNFDAQTTLQLYAANGTKVSDWEISEHESFSVDLLPAGIYFYFIHSGEKNYVGKMIKV